MTIADDIGQEIAALARLLMTTEVPTDNLAELTNEDWLMFTAGVDYGLAATVLILQRRGIIPTQPEDPQ